MFETIRKLFADESGASAVEYGLLVALIALAAAGAMQTLGGGLNTMFGNASTQLTAAAGG